MSPNGRFHGDGPGDWDVDYTIDREETMRSANVFVSDARSIDLKIREELGRRNGVGAHRVSIYLAVRLGR